MLTQGLVGLGGVGKSALALEYAHRRYSAKQVDLAWWFVAEKRSILLANMASLYSMITGRSGSGEDAEQGAMALRNWLERSPYRWLVIFDNAEPRTLDGILPEKGSGQVIVTSRVSDWLAIGNRRVVGTLSRREAVTLLVEITGLTASEDTELVAEELGGLALAIEQAAAYIRQTRTGYRDYLDALRADPQTVYAIDLAQAESIEARVWRRSLDRITGGQKNHPAALLLGVMSYMSPDDIPRELFGSAAIKNVQLLNDIGAPRLTLAIGELAAYSLIGVDSTSSAINVHRVVQHLTRLDAQSRGCASDYATAAIGLLDACI